MAPVKASAPILSVKAKRPESPETPSSAPPMYYQSSKVQPYSLAVFPKRNEMKRFFSEVKRRTFY